MCGIAGIVDFKNQKIDKIEALNFFDSVDHRAQMQVIIFLMKIKFYLWVEKTKDFRLTKSCKSTDV